jgi:hypothetical protein
MLASIIASIVKIIEHLFGIFKTKEEVKQREFEIKNTEEQRVKAEKREDVHQKDVAEKLVKDSLEGTDEQKKAALEEIRRRVAG